MVDGRINLGLPIKQNTNNVKFFKYIAFSRGVQVEFFTPIKGLENLMTLFFYKGIIPD